MANRTALMIAVIGMLALSTLAAPAGAVATDNSTAAQTNETTAASTTETCEGTPTMARNSITAPLSTMSEDRAGLVEANFRVSENLPDDCTVYVDLQFSFAQSGFQFAGGSVWDQSATDIVATEFTTRPGEIRSLDAEIMPRGAEVGDSVTVVADYEIWYEGHKEDSLQLSGVRKTLDVVEQTTPAPETSGSETEDIGTENSGGPESTPGTTGPDSSPLALILNSATELLAVFGLVVIATVLAWKGPTILGFSS